MEGAGACIDFGLYLFAVFFMMEILVLFAHDDRKIQYPYVSIQFTSMYKQITLSGRMDRSIEVQMKQ